MFTVIVAGKGKELKCVSKKLLQALQSTPKIAIHYSTHLPHTSDRTMFVMRVSGTGSGSP